MNGSASSTEERVAVLAGESAGEKSARDARGALAYGILKLEAEGVSPSVLSAELLLLHVLGRDRTWLYAHPEQVLSNAEQSAYEHLLDRRAAGVPAQHLTGVQEFWGLAFEVTPSVLIPRPETEHLIEVVLARLAGKTEMPLQIADIGTGSGCLAVALASEFRHARIVATDISAATLEVAPRNAARHSVAGRIDFRRMNLLDGYLENRPPASDAGPAGRQFDPQSNPQLDVIVSNPPYIGLCESAQLPREVRDHEPHSALFAGERGLDLYAPLVAQARTLLRPGGMLAVEVGHDGAAYVRSLLAGPAWSDARTERDLAGIERVVSARRAMADHRNGCPS